MTAEEAYRWLIGADGDFDTHVLASILALALAETAAGGCPLAEAAGYTGLPDDLAVRFPHAVETLTAGGTLLRGDDELQVLDLLRRGATDGKPLEALLAQMIARRAQRPNHLWQDLGLQNRGELSALMTAHFVRLARRNAADMKWKKFFFRTICRDGESGLCAAPCCSECCDFEACFGAEDGESLLARLRYHAEATSTVSEPL